jgi:hypothetical protein
VATAFKERVFPGRLGAFIDPDQIATAVADGIEARAARIIRPKLWGQSLRCAEHRSQTARCLMAANMSSP